MTSSVSMSGRKIAIVSHGSTERRIVQRSAPTSATRASPVSARDRLVIASSSSPSAASPGSPASSACSSRSSARAPPIARVAGCGGALDSGMMRL
jgi:hypothetical protein